MNKHFKQAEANIEEAINDLKALLEGDGAYRVELVKAINILIEAKCFAAIGKHEEEQKRATERAMDILCSPI